jgi:putative transposase
MTVKRGEKEALHYNTAESRTETLLREVFTHPYKPQENGHIESFHAILVRSWEMKEYRTINDFETHLEHFYQIYNNVRIHGSIQHLSPNAFSKLWKNNMINIKPHKKLKHKFQIFLKVPHYRLKPNGDLRELSEESMANLSIKNRRTSTLNT